MLLTEFDEELFAKTMKEEGREEGRTERRQGRRREPSESALSETGFGKKNAGSGAGHER